MLTWWLPTTISPRLPIHITGPLNFSDMRLILILALSLITSLAWTQVDSVELVYPSDFPVDNTPSDSDAFYTQEGGSARKMLLSTLRTYFQTGVAQSSDVVRDTLYQITNVSDTTGIGGPQSNDLAVTSGNDTLLIYDGNGWQVLPLGGDGGGGSSYSYYDTGNDSWVIADGPGTTFVKNATTGEMTFDIPDGVDVKGGGWLSPSTDGDGSNDFFLQLNYAGAVSFNAGIATARRPIVEVHDGNTTISRANPNFKTNTVQTGITGIGSGNIEVLIDDAGSLFPTILFIFSIP